ncbi:ATP-binding protein [Marinobacter sp. X15-166B]|uniref:ATP-binding protein n=1 Tax=Marinobacter sp. X15-166B TaxID=1897620 RepID=UPI00085BC140|nr:ATP-binding protein [Marinobacter sp. X15-166B]OEY66752.1 AAA family ATPase [Marinobacter sp. X15-166B]
MSAQTDWLELNERYLAATVAWLRLKLLRLVPESTAVAPSDASPKGAAGWFRRNKGGDTIRLPGPSADSDDEQVAQAYEAMHKLEAAEPPPALTLLANALGLSTFDREVLALCAAMELDTGIADLCAKAQNDGTKHFPTFALAFTLFDDPDWHALAPNAPLRYWRVLEINQPGSQPLTSATLGTDERIVNYLKGLNYLDDRLAPLLDSIVLQSDPDELPPSQRQVVDQIVGGLKASNGQPRPPVIELLGHDTASKQMIAARVTASLALNLFAIDQKNIPGQTGDFETFVRLWERESRLMPLALYVVGSGAEPALLKRFLERSSGLIFVDVEEAGTPTARHGIAFEINKPTPQEQQQLWHQALQGQQHQSRRLAEQFSFTQAEIQRLATAATNQTDAGDSAATGELWQACRLAARAGMEQLAQRIDAKADWDHLVLPAEQKALLQQITDQVAQRNRVYEDWGFREQMNRGLGINALFAGDSGTGKTMAAEVIANALALDLYRIDLSSVVSKYIGETEKNLRKLFDGAEDSGAILLFDEADALFGKRSEVKDSHDRYANIEINYLLQRMEGYRGLAILATNMKNALDKAFVRRLRFIVDFPFPGIEQRAEIWQKVFPPQTPVSDHLDFQRLAKLSLTGGNIHNVALNAAFLAAQHGGQITMPLILNAARTEYQKLERPAKESDFRWQGPTGVVL